MRDNFCATIRAESHVLLKSCATIRTIRLSSRQFQITSNVRTLIDIAGFLKATVEASGLYLVWTRMVSSSFFLRCLRTRNRLLQSQSPGWCRLEESLRTGLV